MKRAARERYVQEILERYRNTPGTRGRIRNADRRLAEDLYRRGVSANNVRTAILLAAARRAFRDPELGHIEPIGSLHYFLPALDEIQRQPIDPDYIDHIEARLAACPAPDAGTGHRSP